ncbi:FMN-binding negative transcriptional regulator [Paraglaciecola sp. MB-3u-78]|jgi:transcriptional regulator|uniref:FMN-binding negative transcriptional regulator n=1 Tax=Paraglaciecola sp. MB-3u-78 TaxID=2058332 RepID=UPI000C31EC3C|nr:FMN-binding negative transcriptional regulator [Paraglaciecola sp. MB-3u-78]PKG99259.1 transcriptional regulator [Paraglaciecola sp. MB-3u-78]
MFTPNKFKMIDLSEQQQFIHEFGFGVIVSNVNGLSATHLPFVLQSNEGEQGVLYAHCAKANPLWKSIEGQNVLVIFTGPHAYISPSWYNTKPAVPTWNYTAVHAYGVASLLNPQDTLKTVDQVVEKYEPQLLVDRDIVTDTIKHKMLAGIVGFKIELRKLQGKLKLGQHRSKDDQAGVYKTLSSSGNSNDLALAKYMQKINIGCH